MLRLTGGLSFHSDLLPLTCTSAAEQEPLCLFLCGTVASVCLTQQRILGPRLDLTSVVVPVNVHWEFSGRILPEESLFFFLFNQLFAVSGS